MREIKFRAMTQPPKDFADYRFTSTIVFGTALFYDPVNAWLCSHDKTKCLAEGTNKHIVKPETIEQFTGLRDKNGKEIYEGDILHWVAWGCPMDEYVELQKTYKLIVEWSGCGFDIPYEDEVDKCYEVIGNIHENPELLK